MTRSTHHQQALQEELRQPFRAALKREYRRTLQTPYEVPIVVIVNGALMSSAWFFLPPSLRDELFTLHSSLAYALVLSAWMYSDVPATNLMGADPERAAAVVDDPLAFRQFLYVKNLVLWSYVTPACIVVAVIFGIVTHTYLSTLYSVIWIGVVPFGMLAISAWFGIAFPYHPMPLRLRWRHRAPHRRMLIRWMLLVTIPYVLVPMLGAAMMVPSLLLWGFASPHGVTERLPDDYLGWGVALACVIAGACTLVGHRVSFRIARRRRDVLLAFLDDASRG